MKNKTFITVLMLLLVLLWTQRAPAQVLDRDSIRITIRINERIEVEIDNNLLDFDLGAGVSSQTRFRVITNTPLTVSFQSTEEGLGEGINDLFEYVVVYKEEGVDKERKFNPGSYIPTGIIAMEPGNKEWKLIIRLRDDLARQWKLILEEGIQNIEMSNLGTEWTELSPGVYKDEIKMTFHKYDIDGYFIKRFE